MGIRMIWRREVLNALVSVPASIMQSYDDVIMGASAR